MLVSFSPVPCRPDGCGTRLSECFRDASAEIHNGEYRAFAAQDDAGCVAQGGFYDGYSLAELWREHPEMFCSRFSRFPMTVSLAVTSANVQAHSAVAGCVRDGNAAWYFLDAPQNGEIVLGQTARNEQELRQQIAQGDWNVLLKQRPVQVDSFVYIPAGTVFAPCSDAVIYRVEQASGRTYSLLENGQASEDASQTEQAIGCVRFELPQPQPVPFVTTFVGASVITYVRNESFSIKRYCFDGVQQLEFATYALMTCIAGEGAANGETVRTGDNFLISAGSVVGFSGKMELMCACEA